MSTTPLPRGAPDAAAEFLFAGPGEMRARCRAFDWASTPLGPVSGWPASLRTAVDICLASADPVTIMWGPRFVQIYNDAYVPIAAERHPAILGRSAAESWRDGWPVIGPMVEGVRADGVARAGENVPIVLRRDGRDDERFFSFLFSAVRDESGRVGGVFHRAIETTARVRAERRAVAERAEREGAEAALRESERRFRQMADAMPQIVWITDAEGRVEFFNRQWAAYTGLAYEPATAAEVAATTVHPDDAAVTMERFEAARRGAAVFEVEHRIRSAVGDYRWFLVRAEPYRDAKTGRVLRWYGASVDIHDRKVAEEALRASEARLRLALDVAELGTWSWDLATGEGDLDARGAEIVGLPPGVLANVAEAQFKSIHPDDVARVQAEAAAGVAGGEAFNLAYRVVSPDGGVHHVASRARAFFDGAGRPVRLVGTNRDVTAEREAEMRLRASEERFRLLVENVRDYAIFLLDGRGAIAEWTAGAERVTGYAAGEVVGRGAALLYPPDGGAAGEVEGVLAEAAAAGRAERAGWRARKGGERFWADEITTAVRDAGGALRGFATICRDMTGPRGVEVERERALAQSQAARAEAEAANRMKDEFLATVSHELRTPLNAILGWATMLRSASLDAPASERALETIERNARAQARLIEDLLDLSRILQGKFALALARVELARVVEAALEAVRPAAEAKGVRLEAELDAGAAAVGDAERLQQVAWNLLANAIKFTPRGGAVRASLRGGPSYVELVVRDTGEGIAPAFLPHVFEPFRQADGGLSRRAGGLGLGLSIVRSLVELHGGTVSAESEGEGKGATFAVRLPAEASRGATPPARPAPPESARPADCPPALEGLRVLVVDDEPDARELIAFALGGCGAVVAAAAGAAEALARLERERFDVLVSDVGMPGEDGLSLARRLRALPPDRGGCIPAVALTAYARAEDRARALGAGFDAHLAKPIETSELARAVASVAQAARAGASGACA